MMNHLYELLLALGVLSPLVSFWILVFWGPRLGKPASGWFAVVFGMGVPLACATYVLVGWLNAVHTGEAATLTANAFRFHWADLGNVPVIVGVKLDSLTVAMYFMVTFIAFWIFFFSVGYMTGHSDEVEHQSKYSRFFAYLSLFGFSMLGLVVSSSLLFLFIFWELVGLCSYLLIGFYFDRPYASRAAIKAFVTNRVGDFGFLIGLMLVYFQLGTLDLDEAAVRFAEQYAAGTGIFASTYTLFGWSLATIMGVGLFCGAMGKSAQFPLHVWLPDAMAGPTPVSALIHAATMVAAGVYLVARIFRLMTPDALMFVAVIGCLTLTLMALVAIVQTDIKKCLAYSTLSQLGYMIFGLGCGAWVAALFHLITHAFFKAMLFLGSGQVIEGCHHEQDMRKMGGLMKKMPVTGLTFLVGVLAIAGAGIPGSPIGLGGFFSKDEILAVAYARAFEWDDYKKHEAHEEGHGETHGSGHAKFEDRSSKFKDRTTSVRLASDQPTTPPSETSTLEDEFSETEIDRLVKIGGKQPLSAGAIQLPREMAELSDEEAVQSISRILRKGARGSENERSRAKQAAVGFIWQFDKERQSNILKSLREADRQLLAPLVRQSDREGEPHAGDSQITAGKPVPHGELGKSAMFKRIPALPKWMFWLAIITAYVTPFYMMRAWWLTFMGKPRDEHVHHHAHETPLMFIPLVVLAIGTFVSSYFLFRPLIADAASAASAAPLVLATDGHLHTPAIAAAHAWLKLGVGGAFVVGFFIAIAIYARGLATAEFIRRLPGVSLIHALLVRKYFFDEVYDFVWVRGCVGVAKVARFIDTWFVDLIFNILASATERLAAFAGMVIDKHGVDGVFNGMAATSMDVSDIVRGPQTGRIRNYVLFAAGVATIIVVCLLWFGLQPAQAATVGMLMR
jgi:proton-translocating NADH-quinone oxidoreductase chain L